MWHAKMYSQCWFTRHLKALRVHNHRSGGRSSRRSHLSANTARLMPRLSRGSDMGAWHKSLIISLVNPMGGMVLVIRTAKSLVGHRQFTGKQSMKCGSTSQPNRSEERRVGKEGSA